MYEGRTLVGDITGGERVGRQKDRAGEERRRRWKEVKPNMAAILCIPVVDGEASKQAGAAPKVAFNASHLPECASTERTLYS